MAKTLDGFGKACPMPLVMAKKEIDAGNIDFTIKVDNDSALKNVTRLGKKKGLSVAVETIDGGWALTFGEGDGNTAEPDISALLAESSNAGNKSGYAFFVGKDHVGEGDSELGRNLMKMAIYTLSESDEIPSSILFMNSGVKLLCGEEPQVVENVKTLEEKGCEVLVCGTCLDFYDIKDKLEIGEVSNMYDILGRMQEAAKAITL